MTIEEASEKYCIPIKVLRRYEQMNLYGTVKKVIGQWQYDDRDLERLSMIITLYDIGFGDEDINEYMHLLLSGENEESCLQMLNEKRKSTLDKIHFYEKRISNLDYLRHEIKKDMEEN